jgi:hypothetical protein
VAPDRELTVDGVSNARINILSNTTTGASQLMFGDSSDSQVGRIYYDHTDNTMQFYTSGGQHMFINATGSVALGSSTPSWAHLGTRASTDGAWAGRFENTHTNGEGVLAVTASQAAAVNAFEARGGGGMVFTARANGNVGIGDVISQSKFTVNQTTAGEYIAKFNHTQADAPCLLITTAYTGSSNPNAHITFQTYAGSVGTIKCNQSSTAYNTSSDYRLKENLVPITDSIERVKTLKPYRFNFIADPDKTVDGFVAHEVFESGACPEAISGEKDAMRMEEYEITPAVMGDDGIEIEPAVMGEREIPDHQGIDQAKLVPLLTAALQDAIKRIEILENA